MTSKPALVYWDSCVFISCIQRDPRRFGTLEAIVDEAKSGRAILVASTMGVAETVKLSGDDKSWKQEEGKIRAFFDNEFIEIVNVTREIGENAARIGREHGLKPADAIHVATAIKYGCKCLHTYDGDDRTAKRKRYLLDWNGKIGVPPLRIEIPKPIASSLFDRTRPQSPPNAGDSPNEAL